MWYNKDMRLLGIFYILVAIGIPLAIFEDINYLSYFARRLYEVNGLGIIFLLLSLFYVGKRLVQNKKISSIKRQLVGFLFYLSLLGIFQSTGIFAGLIGTLVVSLVSGPVALILGIPVVLFLFYKLYVLHEEDYIATRVKWESERRREQIRIERVESKPQRKSKKLRRQKIEHRKTMHELFPMQSVSKKPEYKLPKDYKLPSVDLLEG